MYHRHAYTIRPFVSVTIQFEAQRPPVHIQRIDAWRPPPLVADAEPVDRRPLGEDIQTTIPWNQARPLLLRPLAFSNPLSMMEGLAPISNGDLFDMLKHYAFEVTKSVHDGSGSPRDCVIVFYEPHQHPNVQRDKDPCVEMEATHGIRFHLTCYQKLVWMMLVFTDPVAQREWTANSSHPIPLKHVLMPLIMRPLALVLTRSPNGGKRTSSRSTLETIPPDWSGIKSNGSVRQLLLHAHFDRQHLKEAIQPSNGVRLSVRMPFHPHRQQQQQPANSSPSAYTDSYSQFIADQNQRPPSPSANSSPPAYTDSYSQYIADQNQRPPSPSPTSPSYAQHHASTGSPLTSPTSPSYVPPPGVDVDTDTDTDADTDVDSPLWEAPAPPSPSQYEPVSPSGYNPVDTDEEKASSSSSSSSSSLVSGPVYQPHQLLMLIQLFVVCYVHMGIKPGEKVAEEMVFNACFAAFKAVVRVMVEQPAVTGEEQITVEELNQYFPHTGIAREMSFLLWGLLSQHPKAGVSFWDRLFKDRNWQQQWEDPVILMNLLVIQPALPRFEFQTDAQIVLDREDFHLFDDPVLQVMTAATTPTNMASKINVCPYTTMSLEIALKHYKSYRLGQDGLAIRMIEFASNLVDSSVDHPIQYTAIEITGLVAHVVKVEFKKMYSLEDGVDYFVQDVLLRDGQNGVLLIASQAVEKILFVRQIIYYSISWRGTNTFFPLPFWAIFTLTADTSVSDPEEQAGGDLDERAVKIPLVMLLSSLFPRLGIESIVDSIAGPSNEAIGTLLVFSNTVVTLLSSIFSDAATPLTCHHARILSLIPFIFRLHELSVAGDILFVRTSWAISNSPDHPIASDHPPVLFTRSNPKPDGIEWTPMTDAVRKEWSSQFINLCSAIMDAHGAYDPTNPDANAGYIDDVELAISQLTQLTRMIEQIGIQLDIWQSTIDAIFRDGTMASLMQPQASASTNKKTLKEQCLVNRDGYPLALSTPYHTCFSSGSVYEQSGKLQEIKDVAVLFLLAGTEDITAFLHDYEAIDDGRRLSSSVITGSPFAKVFKEIEELVVGGGLTYTTDGRHVFPVLFPSAAAATAAATAGVTVTGVGTGIGIPFLRPLPLTDDRVSMPTLSVMTHEAGELKPDICQLLSNRIRSGIQTHSAALSSPSSSSSSSSSTSRSRSRSRHLRQRRTSSNSTSDRRRRGGQPAVATPRPPQVLSTAPVVVVVAAAALQHNTHPSQSAFIYGPSRGAGASAVVGRSNGKQEVDLTYQ